MVKATVKSHSTKANAPVKPTASAKRIAEPAKSTHGTKAKTKSKIESRPIALSVKAAAKVKAAARLKAEQSKRTTPEAFWAWFQVNAARVSELLPIDPGDISREVTAHLKAYQGDLVWEVSAEDGKAWTFAISADGNPGLFGDVQELVAVAPKIRGWKIEAFRQRGSLDAKIDMGGAVLGPDDIWFSYEPVGSGDDTNEDGNGENAESGLAGGRIALTLWIRGLNKKNNEALSGAAIMLLDNALGEFDAVTRIASLDRGALPDDPGSLPDLLPFRELPRVVDALNH